MCYILLIIKKLVLVNPKSNSQNPNSQQLMANSQRLTATPHLAAHDPGEQRHAHALGHDLAEQIGQRV